MIIPMHRRLAASLVAFVALAAGCATTEADEASTVDVSSTDDSCVVSTAEVASGEWVFSVANDGSEVTEFYLYYDI
jgi:iron uptake system component EfeO